jgi:hypothetical protein
MWDISGWPSRNPDSFGDQFAFSFYGRAIRRVEETFCAGLQHMKVKFGRAQTIDDNAFINTYIPLNNVWGGMNSGPDFSSRY